MTTNKQQVAADAHAAIIAEHAALIVQEKALKARKDELTARLREIAGEATELTVGGVVVVTVPFRTNSNVRANVVKDLAPEVYNVALNITPYRPVLHA